MENQLTEEQLKEIASQLSCPKGEAGIKTAKLMNINNIGMIKSTIEKLQLTNGDNVLELGPANAGHLTYLLDQAKYLKYFGVDVSETMMNEAKKINQPFIDENSAFFYLIDGNELPFPTLRFDKVFTVNTIYFWQNPSAYLAEIKRVMKPGACISIGFADKNFMQQLPFTPYGFKLYYVNDVVELLEKAGFSAISFEEKNEQVQSNADTFVTRNYYVIKAFA